MCSSGLLHTITLSDDGIVHSFGRNGEGQLGLGHNLYGLLPTPIPNLPQINMISCGDYFTVCVDHEGFIWSFGKNNSGQLGTGNTTNFNVPQKVQNIPPVLSVSCGSDHTLIITNDSNLWSCGRNDFGQLCHGDTEDRLIAQKTSLSNISKISTGKDHSLFQNNKGEIFSCGHNEWGECGLGHFNDPQITPSLIPNTSSNIVQFVCGANHNLFLDSEGFVFSVGLNARSQLGLGHNTNQNELNKIPNIPPIKTISCENSSCYLIDFEGNLWSFGSNGYGQLDDKDAAHINTPKIIPTLKYIKQISCGRSPRHFFAKNSQNQILVIGFNYWGPRGPRNKSQLISIPKEINSQDSSIWGSKQWKGIMCSEATKMMEWKKEEMKMIEKIQSNIKTVKINLLCTNNNKIRQEFPQNSFESWNEVDAFLNEKLKQINSKIKEKQNIELNTQKDVQIFEKELENIKNVRQLQSRKKEIEENLLPKAKHSQRFFEETFKKIGKIQKILEEMCLDVSIFCKNEKEMNEELVKLYSEKKFEEFDCSDISKLLWKMDLTKYQQIFETSKINGKFVAMPVDKSVVWNQLGVEKRDCCLMMFHFEMMKAPGYLKTLSSDYDFDCCVCSHASPEKTIHLLQEYEIPFDRDLILNNNFCTPIFTFPAFTDILVPDALSPDGIQIMIEIEKWKKIHKNHLKTLRSKEIKREFEYCEEGGPPLKIQKLTNNDTPSV